MRPRRPLTHLAVALVALALAGGCGRSDAAGSGGTVVDLAPSARDLASVLGEHAAQARAQKLRPVVEISAVWCRPCQVLKQSLQHPAMRDAFAGTYLIRIDLDAFERQLPTAGIRVENIPVFVALDDRGRPSGRRIDGSAWTRDDAETMAPVLKTFLRQ